MTLTQLAYLVAVDRHGHFGRAARACFVTQPTLSMQVQKLEKELGVEIFDRSRAPVRPTELGRLIVEQARRTVREAARISDLLQAHRGETVGELRVGVIPTIGPYLLPRFVHALAERHPGMTLRVEELPTDAILQRLRAETLDAGVVATEDEGAGLHHELLYEEPFVAYVNARHPLARTGTVRQDELSREDVWVLSEAHCLRAQVLGLCRQGTLPEDGGPRCAPGVRFESGNLETLKRLVENGEGMTLLPALAAEYAGGGAGATARVVPFDAPVPTRRILLVRRRASLKRHLVRTFVQALVEGLPPGVCALPPRPAEEPDGRRYFAYLDLEGEAE